MTGRDARWKLSLLQRTIQAAEQIQRDFPESSKSLALGIVAYGTLARSIRFARVVQLVPEDLAYEALALFRCMVEIQINLSWIRRDPTGDRANRFLQFEPLERLELIKEMPDFIASDHAKQIVSSLEARRDEARLLFATQNSKGETRWAREWAQVPNLRARLDELMKAEGSNKVPFTYVLYRWASTVVHGGPVSIASVLETSEEAMSPSTQPLSDPTSVYGGAAASLLMVCSDVAAIGSLSDAQRAAIRELVSELIGQTVGQSRNQDGVGA